MSDNNIVNPNAEVQESSAPAETTASTNAPVQAEVEAPVAAPVAAPVQTAHDDFDWSIDKRNVASYTKEEKLKYDEVYEGTFKAVTDGELVKGLVVALTKTDVVINIGVKSNGLVSSTEFR